MAEPLSERLAEMRRQISMKVWPPDAVKTVVMRRDTALELIDALKKAEERAERFRVALKLFMASHERINDPGYVCGCVECCNAEEALAADQTGGE